MTMNELDVLGTIANTNKYIKNIKFIKYFIYGQNY